MRPYVQLAVCALVGLAASPVAFALPLRDCSGGALDIRAPQGVADEQETGVAPDNGDGQGAGSVSDPSNSFGQDPGSVPVDSGAGSSPGGSAGQDTGPDDGQDTGSDSGAVFARDETSPIVEDAVIKVLLPMPDARRAAFESNNLDNRNVGSIFRRVGDDLD